MNFIKKNTEQVKQWESMLNKNYQKVFAQLED